MAYYHVEISRSAAKDLRGIAKEWIPKIVAVIEALETDARPPGGNKLVGSDQTYRIRMGDYRVVYEVADHTLIVLVVRIRHRRDAYR